jgi:hypothetical protein
MGILNWFKPKPAVCDVCNRRMRFEEGYSLRGDQVLLSGDYWLKVLAKPEFASLRSDPSSLMMFAGQQASHNSGWLVCEPCSGMFQFDRDSARQLAANRADPPGTEVVDLRQMVPLMTAAMEKLDG